MGKCRVLKRCEGGWGGRDLNVWLLQDGKGMLDKRSGRMKWVLARGGMEEITP